MIKILGSFLLLIDELENLELNIHATRNIKQNT